MSIFLRLLLIITLMSVLFASGTSAIEKCMICHGKADIQKVEQSGRVVSLHIEESILERSVHNGKECTDCHSDVVEIPHKKVDKVNCRRCHYSGNPVGAPEGELYDQYEHSVHGLEVTAGNEKAPVCQDCHGTHDIFEHTQEESSFFRANIPKTCGQCHIDIYATYMESTHGVALTEGNVDTPVCSSCHGEHNIERPTEPTSKVYAGHVSETCSECHDAKGVVNKYGVKTDRTATFDRSFHGVAQEMNNLTVANCASCHGVHDIRTEEDPKSSIHADNIPKTCGKEGCHPGVSASFAEGKIHIDPYSEEAGLLYYITKFFTILTVSTLIGLFAFIMLDLFRRAKNSRQKRH